MRADCTGEELLAVDGHPGPPEPADQHDRDQQAEPSPAAARDRRERGGGSGSSAGNLAVRGRRSRSCESRTKAVTVQATTTTTRNGAFSRIATTAAATPGYARVDMQRVLGRERLRHDQRRQQRDWEQLGDMHDASIVEQPFRQRDARRP